MSEQTNHGVDEVLPPQRLAALGIQHVLVMYAGAVAVPFIISGALGLSPEQRTLLINADLFACGLATIVQSLGFPGVGIRLPVMMGVTFASVAPMLAMIGAGLATNPEITEGRTGIKYFFINDPDGNWVEIVQDDRAL